MSRDPSLSSVPLSTPDAPVLNQVGGKAASLIRLQQAGFDVPHGVVLTTTFFEPWLAEVQSTREWHSVIEMVQTTSRRRRAAAGVSRSGSRPA